MAHFKPLLLVVNMPPNMSPNIPSTPNGLAVKSCEHPKHMAARWHLSHWFDPTWGDNPMDRNWLISLVRSGLRPKPCCQLQAEKGDPTAIATKQYGDV